MSDQVRSARGLIFGRSVHKDIKVDPDSGREPLEENTTIKNKSKERVEQFIKKLKETISSEITLSYVEAPEHVVRLSGQAKRHGDSGEGWAWQIYHEKRGPHKNGHIILWMGGDPQDKISAVNETWSESESELLFRAREVLFP